MKFLIELSGEAKGCTVVPTVSREFSVRIGDFIYIDMDALERHGYDGFLRADTDCAASIPYLASGMRCSVQAELPYPWAKHGLRSNVPIESFCKRGYVASVVRLLSFKIKSMVNQIRGEVL